MATRRKAKNVRKPAADGDPQLARKFSALWALYAQLVAGRDGVRPAFNLDSFQAALEQSVYLYASCYRVAQALAATVPVVTRTVGGERVSDAKADRVLSILRSPNLDQSGFDLLEGFFVHLGINGESLLEKGRNRLGVTSELFLLNPEEVRVVPDPSGRRLASEYLVQVGGRTARLSPDEVIACRIFHPRTPWRGLSPVSGVRREVRSDIAAAEYNEHLLKNGARIGGMLRPTDGEPDEPSWQRIIKEIERQNQGTKNAGRFLALPYGFDFTPDGVSPKDLEYLSGRKYNREAMSASQGAPPMLVQNYDAASYANSEQQLRAFWDYCGKPLLKKCFAALNRAWIWSEIDPSIQLEPDMVGIDAQIDSEKSRVDNARNLLQGGIITINEARRRVGYGPLPDGDKLMVQGAYVPMDPANLENPLASQDAAAQGQQQGQDQAPGAAGQDAQAQDAPAADAPAKAFDPVQRAAIQLAHEKTVRDAERRFRSAVETVLHRQQSAVIERARKAGANATAEQLMPSVEAEARWLFAALQPAWLAVLKDSGIRTLRRLGGVELARAAGDWIVAKARKPVVTVTGTFDTGNPRVARVLESHFFRHLEKAAGTTRQHLEDLVAEFRASAQQGEGVSELVARISGMEAFGGARAESIARTETIGAVNLGALEGFRATDTPAKSWLSERGPDVRDSHKEVDAQTSEKPIGIDEPFTLSEQDRGTAQLQYPGDPDSPGWAAINCRCSLVPEETGLRRAFAAACKAELFETVNQ